MCLISKILSIMYGGSTIPGILYIEARAAIILIWFNQIYNLSYFNTQPTIIQSGI